jgi:hypothetical protein
MLISVLATWHCFIPVDVAQRIIVQSQESVQFWICQSTVMSQRREEM